MSQTHIGNETNQLTRDQLFELTEVNKDLAVSLYMPTHRTGKEIRQDPIRLKNLSREAERQLAEAGHDDDVVRDLLAAPRAFLENETSDFWQHNADGLAIFAAHGFARTYRVPITFDELTVVARRFHVKPLLPYFQGDGRFYVLAVSPKKVRLLEGTKHQVSEVDTDLLPADLRDALNIDEYQSSLQLHTVARGSEGSDNSAAMYHGHGGGNDSDKKEELLKFFRKLDDGIQQFFGVESAPLVFAGVEYSYPIYQQANNYRNLFEKPVTGNFDDASLEALHEAAWRALEPHFAASRQQLSEEFGTKLAREKASDDLEMVVRAAREGRIDTLLLAEGVRKWGVVNADSIEVKDTNTADTEDLLDFAAVHTLKASGTVYLVDGKSMPTDSAVAATLRY